MKLSCEVLCKLLLPLTVPEVLAAMLAIRHHDSKTTTAFDVIDEVQCANLFRLRADQALGELSKKETGHQGAAKFLLGELGDGQGVELGSVGAQMRILQVGASDIFTHFVGDFIKLFLLLWGELSRYFC
jgi:hypothetical protein